MLKTHCIVHISESVILLNFGIDNPTSHPVMFFSIIPFDVEACRNLPSA